jgi:hypothetical protein
MGRAFTCKYITSEMSFTEVLQSKAGQTQQSHPRQAAEAGPATVDHPTVQTPPKWQEAGQSAPAQIVNSLPLDNMARAVTVVQQFMTEFRLHRNSRKQVSQHRLNSSLLSSSLLSVGFGDFLHEDKAAVGEADHSPPISAEINKT